MRFGCLVNLASTHVTTDERRLTVHPMTVGVNKQDDRASHVLRSRFGHAAFRQGQADVVRAVTSGRDVIAVLPTGAGKSTIFSLLMRHYDPQRGRITLDGVDIRELSTGELRSAMGLVLQDVYLFSGSARTNIVLGRDWIGEAEMREAARRVGLDRHIERRSEGCAHPLGERGGNLSVGERQLLSFARALAGDPPILLLDEATSSVDSEIEAQIQRALEELMEGRTSLVIAHRLSTIRGADRILVLHGGVIRESGSHRQLLDQAGLYARLYRLQFATPNAAA